MAASAHSAPRLANGGDSTPEAERVREACRVGRAAEKLQAAAREMAHVATVVEATSQPMARRDPLRAHMDTIYKEVVPLA